MIRHKQNLTTTLEKAEFLPSLVGQITRGFAALQCPALGLKIFPFRRRANHL